MATVIYALTHPLTDEVCYVGKTSEKVPRRLRGHIARAQTNVTPVGNWILALQRESLKPGWIVLEENPTDWRIAERKWIAHYREVNPRLKNLQAGGEGGNPMLSGGIFPKGVGQATPESARKGYQTRKANGTLGGFGTSEQAKANWEKRRANGKTNTGEWTEERRQAARDRAVASWAVRKDLAAKPCQGSPDLLD